MYLGRTYRDKGDGIECEGRIGHEVRGVYLYLRLTQENLDLCIAPVISRHFLFERECHDVRSCLFLKS